MFEHIELKLYERIKNIIIKSIKLNKTNIAIFSLFQLACVFHYFTLFLTQNKK